VCGGIAAAHSTKSFVFEIGSSKKKSPSPPLALPHGRVNGELAIAREEGWGGGQEKVYSVDAVGNVILAPRHYRIFEWSGEYIALMHCFR